MVYVPGPWCANYGSRSVMTEADNTDTAMPDGCSCDIFLESMRLNSIAQVTNETAESILAWANTRSAFDWLLIGTAGCANLVQLLIIWLIWLRSPDSMREYRFYLIGMTLSDFLFDFSIGFMIDPKLWAPDSLGAHSLGFARLLGPNGGRISYALSAFALTNQIHFLMFSTVYRYVNVVSMDHPRLDRIMNHSQWTKPLMIAATLSLSSFVAFLSYRSTLPNETLLAWHFDGYHHCIFTNYSEWERPEIDMSAAMDAQLAEPNLQRTFADIIPDYNGHFQDWWANLDAPNDTRTRVELTIREAHNLTYDEMEFLLKWARMEYSLRAVPLYSPEKTHLVNSIIRGYPIIYMNVLVNALWDFTTVAMCALYGLAIFQVQCICVVASMRVIKYLRKRQASFSRQTYQLQMQLIVLLIIQIIAPFVMISVPVVFVLLTIVDLKFDHLINLPIMGRGFCNSIVLLIVLYSFVNSLLILCFVGPYRKQIAVMARWIWSSRFVASVRRPFPCRSNRVRPQLRVGPERLPAPGRRALMDAGFTDDILRDTIHA